MLFCLHESWTTFWIGLQIAAMLTARMARPAMLATERLQRSEPPKQRMPAASSEVAEEICEKHVVENGDPPRLFVEPESLLHRFQYLRLSGKQKLRIAGKQF